MNGTERSGAQPLKRPACIRITTPRTQPNRSVVKSVFCQGSVTLRYLVLPRKPSPFCKPDIVFTLLLSGLVSGAGLNVTSNFFQHPKVTSSINRPKIGAILRQQLTCWKLSFANTALHPQANALRAVTELHLAAQRTPRNQQQNSQAACGVSAVDERPQMAFVLLRTAPSFQRLGQKQECPPLDRSPQNAGPRRSHRPPSLRHCLWRHWNTLTT